VSLVLIFNSYNLPRVHIARDFVVFAVFSTSSLETEMCARARALLHEHRELNYSVNGE